MGVSPLPLGFAQGSVEMTSLGLDEFCAEGVLRGAGGVQMVGKWPILGAAKLFWRFNHPCIQCAARDRTTLSHPSCSFAKLKG